MPASRRSGRRTTASASRRSPQAVSNQTLITLPDRRAHLRRLPAGKSVFKNGGKIYPDLASTQAAHPEVEIAAFAFPLHDGEFFDVGTASPRYSSWGKFASYPDAFAAAEDFRSVHGAEAKIRIMVPDMQEPRGKDSRGHEVVLGRSVEYNRISVISRLAATVD